MAKYRTYTNMNLKGKNILIGITGSIAAYKMCDVVSSLKKKGINVHVIMTENATKFVSPMTFESLSNNKCSVDTFDRNFKHDIKHISISKLADLAVVAPASANIIGKIANGICDDMLSTSICACSCKKIIAPAMNERMYTNPITQENINKLKKYNYQFINPKVSELACGDVGIGALADTDTIIDKIVDELSKDEPKIEQDLTGKKILITAGPTTEAIDSVRYITNHSSGKMGYAIAENASSRGASVTLISGKTNLKCNANIKRVDVVSAQDMFESVKNNIKSCDALIMSAAVADYKPKIQLDHKMKKGKSNFNLEMTSNPDILKWTGENYSNNKFLCGFCMETENLLERAKEKLISKNLDMIVANNINEENAGFQHDTNKVYIVTKKTTQNLPVMKKSEIAKIILDKVSYSLNKIPPKFIGTN